MATISIVDRARIIMDLVKDGEVANLADYANVEKASGGLALKYAQAFWDAPGFPQLSTVVDPENPTNAELATHYINRVRESHKETSAAARVSTAGETAREAEAAAVAAEGTSDFGNDES